VNEAPPATHPGDELLRVAEAVHAGEVSVAFTPGPTVMAKVGAKLLDVAEASQVPFESSGAVTAYETGSFVRASGERGVRLV
jgi:hypothetical protein